MDHHVKQALISFREILANPLYPLNDMVLLEPGMPLITLALAKEMLRIYQKDWEDPAENLTWLMTLGFKHTEDQSSNIWTLGPIKLDIAKKTGTVTWWCGFYPLDHVKTRQDVRNLMQALRLDLLPEPIPAPIVEIDRDAFRDQIILMLGKALGDAVGLRDEIIEMQGTALGEK